MSAKDLFHEKVKIALVKDGWTITDDPLTLTYETRDVFVDLGAERVLAAEKGTEKIAVEIKMFSMGSKVTALEDAVGQYIVYRGILEEVEPARKLYLAIPNYAEEGIFSEPIGKIIVRKNSILKLVYDPVTEEIDEWTT